eukprot:scaffold31536_cov17-Tisochrysis_lutea.AAC.1
MHAAGPGLHRLSLFLCLLACWLPTARKQLAVPFRGADWPSERSEWAQPDVAILLTQLSYYLDGAYKLGDSKVRRVITSGQQQVFVLKLHERLKDGGYDDGTLKSFPLAAGAGGAGAAESGRKCTDQPLQGVVRWLKHANGA